MENYTIGEIVRLIKVMNGELDHQKDDLVKCDDIWQATQGNASAARRVRVCLQHIKRLAVVSREEFRKFL